MKSFIISVATCALIFFSCNNHQNATSFHNTAETGQKIIEDAPSSAKKYQIKSATITFENKVQSGSFNTVQKTIVYFDDYGLKERKDTYDGDKLTESFFSDGNKLYLLLHEEKKAFDRGKAFRGIEYRFDWNELPSEDRENGKAEKAPNETVAGKDCEVYYYETGGVKNKFAGWSNICLLTEGSGSYGTSVNRAVEIKDGVVSAGLFHVPEGYTLEER